MVGILPIIGIHLTAEFRDLTAAADSKDSAVRCPGGMECPGPQHTWKFGNFVPVHYRLN